SYFLDERGVFVNLYTPSRVRWRQNGREIALEQSTAYPLTPDINLAAATETPETFSIRLRIPAWADSNSSVAVNGERTKLAPGGFHEIRRTWSSGDRIELALERPLRLEAVDDKHPDLVAVMQGPLALFAVGERFLPFKRRDLLSVTQTTSGSAEWRLTTADGTQSFRPYFAIGTGATRLYQNAT